MTKKIILFILLLCSVSPAHAETDQYCISSEKLTEMTNLLSEQSPEMQQAYNELFEILVTKNESDTIENAGCVTQQDLAQICKNVWDDDTETCETFIYAIMSDVKSPSYNTLEYSALLSQTDFSNIDPDAFNRAFNKAVARRRDRHIPSKLQDMGSVFFDQAKEKHINPFILAAISLYESGRGTSYAARKKNNIAGLGGPGKWMSFPTVADSIIKESETVQKNLNLKDLRSLALSGKYCATNREAWFKDISSVTKEMYRNYNNIIKDKK